MYLSRNGIQEWTPVFDIDHSYSVSRGDCPLNAADVSLFKCGGFTRQGTEMKKTMCVALAAITLMLVTPLPGSAGGSHVYFGGSVWVGPGWGWGWGARPWWGWGPGWWGPAYPYYATPPVVVQQSPPVYVQPAPQPQEQYYWYYCQNPQGYYPYVKQCPNGWMKVVPSPNPADR